MQVSGSDFGMRLDSVKPDDLRVQRLVDGTLSPPEAAGVESALASDPTRAQLHQALRGLDRRLHGLARPLDASAHQLLLSRITERLPDTKPKLSARLQITDILLGLSILLMVGI